VAEEVQVVREVPLAIETADRCGITLCAFVRETRAAVFTHPDRIVGL